MSSAEAETPSSIGMDISMDLDNSDQRGIEYEYVDSQSQELQSLLCAVCLSPLCEPYRLKCGHHFCFKCLTDLKLSSCPTCRVAVEEPYRLCKPQDSLILNILDQIQVYCGNKRRGCEWKGPRGNLSIHLRGCSKHACANLTSGCSWIGSFEMREDHLKIECPFRIVDCDCKESGCRWSGPWRDALAKHMKEECEYLSAHLQLIEKQAEADQKAQEERVRTALSILTSELNPRSDDVVRCNVGGEHIIVSRHILTLHPKSVLGMLFSSDVAVQNTDPKTGEVLIDVDPRTFRLVVNFLQFDVVPSPRSPENEYNFHMLLAVAQLWRLDALVQKLKEEEEKVSLSSSLSRSSSSSNEQFPPLLSSSSSSVAAAVGSLSVRPSLVQNSAWASKPPGFSIPSDRAFEDSAIVKKKILNSRGENASESPSPLVDKTDPVVPVKWISYSEFVSALAVAKRDNRSPDFHDLDLSYLPICNCDLWGADLSGCTINNTQLPVILDSVNFRRVNFRRVNLAKKTFKNCLLEDSDFHGCDLSTTAFLGCYITTSALPGAYFLREKNFQCAIYLDGTNRENSDALWEYSVTSKTYVSKQGKKSMPVWDFITKITNNRLFR